MSMGAISRHGSHLDLRAVTIFTNIQFPLNTRLHIKFEENGPGDLEEKSFKGVNGRTDGQTDDGRRVITIAHPEPLTQVSYKSTSEKRHIANLLARDFKKTIWMNCKAFFFYVNYKKHDKEFDL